MPKATTTMQARASLRCLIDRGDIDEALIILGKLVPGPEVDRLQAAARLRQRGGDDIGDLEAAAAADPDSDQAQLDLAQALAARSQYEPALDRLLAVVARRGEGKEPARPGNGRHLRGARKRSSR